MDFPKFRQIEHCTRDNQIYLSDMKNQGAVFAINDERQNAVKIGGLFSDQSKSRADADKTEQRNLWECKGMC